MGAQVASHVDGGMLIERESLQPDTASMTLAQQVDHLQLWEGLRVGVTKNTEIMQKNINYNVDKRYAFIVLRK